MTDTSVESTPVSERQAWHDVPADEVVATLVTDLDMGLTGAVAAQRLQEFGSNELVEAESTTWLSVLSRQFWDVMTLILVIAALLSVAVGELVDAATIVAIILLNGLLGFAQEWKAERALAALRRMLTPTCTVVRDGVEQTIERRDLVPGDIVQLETGDHVPADLRISRAKNLRADESALTGESESVEKTSAPVAPQAALAQRHSMAWTGTIIVAGRAIGVVVNTGTNTQFGRISTLTEGIESDPTPLQRKMAVLGRQLGIAAISVAALVAFIGWRFGKPLSEMVLTGVSLAVAVVPEGLPAVVTMTMALGIRAMVRRKALLRRLQAAESLGSATVICTDKTGTLTQNQMTVQRIWLPGGEVEVTGVGYDPAGHFEQQHQRVDYRQRPDLLALLETGLYCNHATLHKTEQGWVEVGEPTEGAIVVAGFKAWLDPPNRHDVVTEFEFDSNRKRMTLVQGVDGQLIAHTKGASEVILQRCTRIRENDKDNPLSQADRERITAIIGDMASRGLRTLAIARRELPSGLELTADNVETDLTLLGIVGMLDPPRPEVPEAVARAKEAGIRVLMITGDAPETALAIGKSVGLSATEAVTGPALDTMTDEQLLAALQKDIVFARTTPEHKLRIVNALQSQGEVVGMTGDGVNDAPALKKADIGIAMGQRGTDVAKGAADMVLTDDNFSSIVGAIEEGRRQYDNIQKFVRYLLSSNLGEVIAIVASILLRGPLMLLPVQILWMNLVTDGLSAVALGVEPVEDSVMKRPPRRADARMLDRVGLIMVALLGGYVGLATFWLFQRYLTADGGSQTGLAQTVAFTGIIVIQKFNVLNFRFLAAGMTWRGFWTNPWLLMAIAMTIGLQASAVYVPFLQQALHTQPLRLVDWINIAAVAAPVFVVTEFLKRLTNWRSQKS